MRVCTALIWEEGDEWPSSWTEDGAWPPTNMLRTALSRFNVGFGWWGCWNGWRVWLMFSGLVAIWWGRWLCVDCGLSSGCWLPLKKPWRMLFPTVSLSRLVFRFRRDCWLLSWACRFEIMFEIRSVMVFASAWLGFGLCAGSWLVCAMTCCNKDEMIWAGSCWTWIGAPPSSLLDVLAAEAAAAAAVKDDGALSASSLLKVGEQNS